MVIERSPLTLWSRTIKEMNINEWEANASHIFYPKDKERLDVYFTGKADIYKY